MNDYITLHGYQKKEYINRLLQESSIYVMSSFTESFGIVLLEAMSFGIPVIAFDSAEGATELIKNDYNGYLIPNRDKEQIIALIDEEDKRKKIGQNGRTTSMNFTADIVKKEWLKLLKKGR